MNKGGRSDCERATEFDERWAEDATAVIIWKHDIKGGPWGEQWQQVAAMIMVVVCCCWFGCVWNIKFAALFWREERWNIKNSTHFLAGRHSTPDLLPRG